MDRVPRRCLLVALLVLSVAPAATSAAERPGSGSRYVADELIVRFKPGVSGAERADARRDGGATVERALRVPRAQLLDLEGSSVRAAEAAFERDPRVEYAEPNYLVHADSNDPLFGELWGLENLGGTGVPDADVDAPEAWQVALAGSTLVAVVDTGVVLDHPDLAGRIVAGYDFLDDDPIPAELALDKPNTDGFDPIAHGTHVTGTIASVRDNGAGVAGVADQARIMPLRVLNEHGTGSDADIADAFQYAAANGARIVNASLGGSGANQVVEDAITGAPNTLFVVAAGNNALDNDVAPHYPCSYPHANVLCVAASNRSDARASFSNYGDTSVDIAAPGAGIVSTYASFDLVSQQGFEDGGLPAGWTNDPITGTDTWAVSTTHSSVGAQGLAIEPSPGSDTAAVTSLDLSGMHGCQMLLDLKVAVADAGDAFTVETSTAPGVWTPVLTHSTSTGQFFLFGVDLPSGGPVDLRFRFAASAAVGSRLAAIDALRVYCSEDEYTSLSGTSMATPHVSGAAALVLAQDPGLSTTALKDRLLSSGDVSACWIDVTSSERRLNVARALGVAVGAGPTETSCGGGGAASAPQPPPPAPAPRPPPATGTQPPTTDVSGGEPAPPAIDSAAPVVGLAVGRIRRLDALLRSGLRTGVRCSERCTVSARLYARTASGRAVLVGRSARVTSRGGRVTAVVRLSRRGRAFLRRGPRRQTLTLSVTAVDSAGNGRKLRRRVSLRR